MPAKQQYPSPAEQLGVLAQAGKAAGLPFEEVWRRALPPSRPRRRRLLARYAALEIGEEIESKGTRFLRVAADRWQVGTERERWFWVLVDETTIEVRDEFDEPVLEPAGRLYRINKGIPPEGAIRWPRDTFDRLTSYRALVDLEPAWRRAYEDLRPSLSEAALAILTPRELLTGAGAEKLAEFVANGNAIGADVSSSDDDDDLVELLEAA